jgi:hypothetical protein
MTRSTGSVERGNCAGAHAISTNAAPAIDRDIVFVWLARFWKGNERQS